MPLAPLYAGHRDVHVRVALEEGGLAEGGGGAGAEGLALEGHEEHGHARRLRHARLAVVEQRVAVQAVGGQHPEALGEAPLVLEEGRGVELLVGLAQVVPGHALEAALGAHVHLVVPSRVKFRL